MLNGRKKGWEVEESAEDDVFLQYSYFTSLNLSQNCYFLKIILSEIPHLPNHSSCKNSFKPAISPVSFLFHLPLLISSYILFPEIPICFIPLSSVLHPLLHRDIHSPLSIQRHSHFTFLFSSALFPILLSLLTCLFWVPPWPLPLKNFPS